MNRFHGKFSELSIVDVSPLVEWIANIPFEEWPQQNRLDDGKIRPAMITDLGWYGFGVKTDSYVADISFVLGAWGALRDYRRMLSVVMPGHCIPAHRDQQEECWLARIHIPILSNDKSLFIADGESCAMFPGKSYLVNTLAEHEVRNDGETPRIHFMFDVRH